MKQYPIDLDLLLKLRLIVARFGEMDVAKWWNTKGQLGRLGAAALRRGFPRTHNFSQARSVFAVASHRCSEVFDPPGCVTLWRMPEVVEEEFDARWEYWIEHAADWAPFFKKLESLQEIDLVATMQSFEIVDDRDIEGMGKLRLSAEGRSIELPAFFRNEDENLRLLALGFARGEIGSLAVPFARTVEK